MGKKRVEKRKWLNDDKGMHGRIVYHVGDATERMEKYYKKKKETMPRWISEASFELADCARSVCLDFGLYNKKTRALSLKKAMLLAKSTCEFATALEKEIELLDEYEVKFKAKAKKEKKANKGKKKKKKKKKKREVAVIG